MSGIRWRESGLLLAVAAMLALAGCGGREGAPAAGGDTASAAGAAADTAGGAVGAGGAMPAGGDTATTPSAAAPSKPSFEVNPDDPKAAMKWDAATRTATYPIISGRTSVNSAWNFNGYANGGLTIVVPVGSSMVMPFANEDANISHSAGVIAGSAQNIPPAPTDLAFAGASTRRFEAGLRAGETDVMRFTADKPGRYLMICGVPGHGTGGMWVWFEVSSSAKAPDVRVTKS